MFACADRSLTFHARFGGYVSTRLPKVPRSVTYYAPNADVLAVGSSSEVYRLSLETGRFLTPLQSESPGLNVARVCPTHGLLAAGGDDGALQCFDLRAPVATTRLANASAGGHGITCLRFDGAGMTLAVGTEGGTVLLYDLRSSRPVLTKDQLYGNKMVDVKWHTGPGGERRIISSDTRIVRIWDANSGTAYTSIEPEADINDVCIWPGDGLILLATEEKRMAPFFVPSLGPAPRWCAFLENLTEEMEETGQSTLYDDYRFVTRPELERLGLASAIGTPVLRAYMHGFFIDNRLYGKAAALAAPFDYNAYRQQKVKEKLDAERSSHITPRRRLPKVNAALAARLLATEGDEAGTAAFAGTGAAGDAGAADDDGGGGGARPGGNLLRDERFAALFSNADFAVDESDPAYKTLHPNAPPAAALLREHYEAVDDEEEDMPPERPSTSGRKPEAATAPSQPRMFAARGEAEAAAFAAGQSLARARATPLGQRAAAEAADGDRRVVRHGAQEFSWVPGASGHKQGRGGKDAGTRHSDGGRGSGKDAERKHKRRRMQFSK